MNNAEAVNASNMRVEMEVEVLGLGPEFVLNISVINYEETTY